MKPIVICRLALMLTLMIFSAGSAYALTAQDYMQSAKRYLDTGDIKKAVIEAKNALQEEPENGEIRFFLGEIYLKLSQGAAAEKEFRFARRAGISPSRMLAPLAEAYLAQRNYRAVLDEIKPVEGDTPERQAELLVLRARAYLMSGKSDDAARALENAGALVADNADLEMGRAMLAMVDGQHQAVRRHVERVLQLEPRNAQALTVRADLLRRDGQQEEALRTYQEALVADPFNREALLGSATVNVEQRRLDEAEAALKRLDTFSPGMLHRQYLAAVIAFHRKEYDGVQELMSPVLRVAPNYLQGRLLAGVASYLKGEIEVANSHLSDFLKVNPGHMPARKLLGMLKIRLGEPDKAVEVLEVVREQGDKDAQFLALLGGAYLEAGDASNAMLYLEKAAEIAPDAASIQSQIGLGNLALGKTEEAVTHLENAVKMEPGLLQADLILVQIHLRKREYDKALAVAEAMLAKGSSNPLPYNLMAAANLGKGEADKARKFLLKALEVDPGFRPARINLARLDIQDGDFGSARAHYESVLKLDGTHTQAYLGLAQLEERQGKRDKAVEWLIRAVDEDPGALRPGVMLALHYLSQNEPLKALPVARSLVDANPENPVALETLANVQLRNGETDNAIGSYEKLGRMLPDNPAVRIRLGELHLRKKAFGASREAFEQALALQENSLPALVGIGALELESGDPEAARVMAEKVIAVYPKSPLGAQLMGDIHRQAKDHPAAAAAYQQAFQLEPSSQRATLTYQMRRASGDVNGAIQMLEQWVETDPNDAGAHLMLANEYQALQQFPAAIGSYERVRELRPDHHVAWNNLAWLYHERDDRRALEYARKARELAPQQPEILDTYGWIELLEGNTAEGVKAIQEAAVFGPHIPTIQYHLAVAQEKDGRPDAARKTLARLLKSGKKFPELGEAEKLLKRLEAGK